MAKKTTGFITKISGQASKKISPNKTSQIKKIKNKKNSNNQLVVKKGNSRQPAARPVFPVQEITQNKNRVNKPPNQKLKTVSEKTVKLNQQDIRKNKKVSTLSNSKNINKNGGKKQTIKRNSHTKQFLIPGSVSFQSVGKNLSRVKLEKFNK